MVKKTYFKTIYKTFTENISRFTVMCLVIMLGVAFVAGLGTLSSSLTDSINDNYQKHKGLDLVIKSKKETGFTIDDINQIKKNHSIKQVKPLTTIDQDHTRVIFSDWSDTTFHPLSIVKGRKIEHSNEVLVDRVSNDKVNDIIILWGEEYQVVGMIENPSYYTSEPEISMMKQKIEHIYYFDTNFSNAQAKHITTDLYVKLDDTQISKNIFSKEYENKVKDIVSDIKKENTNIVVLTLEENLSYHLTKSYGEKIKWIAAIFPMFFIVVSGLVAYATMNRLIEEERAIIGCYRSLGISKRNIILKYLLFTFFTCLIGSVVGFFLGIQILPTVIYPAFDAMFYMPELTSYRVIAPGMVTAVLMLLLLCFITVISTAREMGDAPSNLLKPKSPKVGKKVFLENISMIWKRLSFKYKSSIRNIFRYKVNLYMTIISVAGSTALTFAGFGLYAIAISPKTTEIPSKMADSFALISAIIVAFAAILCILVIFNITNMNIQERKREIATLRVLGYQKKEVSLYIYREINITTMIGVLLGMPLGYVFLKFIFEFLEFGNIQNVDWYYYLITVGMMMLFVLSAELLLNHKIQKIDMNGSLKSND